jgi:hypothetical protein
MGHSCAEDIGCGLRKRIGSPSNANQALCWKILEDHGENLHTSQLYSTETDMSPYLYREEPQSLCHGRVGLLWMPLWVWRLPHWLVNTESRQFPEINAAICRDMWSLKVLNG